MVEINYYERICFVTDYVVAVLVYNLQRVISFLASRDTIEFKTAKMHNSMMIKLCIAGMFRPA